MNICRCVNCMGDMGSVSGTVCPKCHFDNARAAEMRSPYAMRQNTILHGRYLIGNVLGQGGFGITYIAFDLVLSIKVAVKEYFPMSIAVRDPGNSNTLLWHSTQVNTEQRQCGQESFLKEARRIAKIDQIPSIVRVRDTFFDNETAYIIMDFVEGITLKDKLSKSGSISFSECMCYLTPMMEGLAQVHKAGIIHRDISPDNIIIQADGSVKLLDLGAAKDISMGQGQQSQLVAKKGFSPLEQYTEAGRIGPWTDVYALCATIYYCVTGRMLPNALDRIGNEEITFPDDMKQPLAAHVRSALEAGLAPEAGKRIQSVGELLARLRGVKPQPDEVGAQDAGTVKDEKPDGSKARKFRKPMKWIGAAVACVAGIFIVIAVVGGWHRIHPVPTSGLDDNPSEAATGSETEIGAEADNGPVTEADAAAQMEALMVEKLGTTNANLLNYGGDITIPGEYEYYIAADNGLYICVYDQEDSTFYLGDAEKAFDDAGYITLGEEEVFFLATIDGSGAVCRMDRDGGNIRQLYFTTDGKLMRDLQYVRFSDQREYLYFLAENEQDGAVASLYRCDLENNETELLVEGDLFWYNLYEDSLYYTELADSMVVLSKTGLDGGEKQVLDSDRQFLYGFAQEDTLYLLSLRDEALLACNLDGTPKSGYEGFYQLEFDQNYPFGYGDGWIYYTGTDGNIHRVRENGTGDGVLLEGISALRICYSESWLWMVDSQPADKRHQNILQVYFADKTGNTVFDIGASEYSWNLSTGYVKDFQYEVADNGEEIIITGYTGNMTSLEIPKEIEGKTVTAIGENAFQGSSLQEIGLPEGVREIDSYAFYQCEDLNFVGLPEGLDTIGVGAFGECNKLTEIELPESLRMICNLAFAETALSEVHIPANVEGIGSGAFAVIFSAGLTEFTVSSENRFFETYEGVLFERYFDSFDNPLPGELCVLAAVPSGFTGSLVVPNGVVGLDTYAFAHCKGMTLVIMPPSVDKINDNVFFGAELEELMVCEECSLPSDCGFASYISEYYRLNYESELEMRAATGEL